MKAFAQERVLDHLMKHGTITNKEASDLYGNYRLSETIRKLRSKGYVIETVMQDGANRFGEPRKYGVYKLQNRSEAVRGGAND